MLVLVGGDSAPLLGRGGRYSRSMMVNILLVVTTLNEVFYFRLQVAAFISSVTDVAVVLAIFVGVALPSFGDDFLRPLEVSIVRDEGVDIAEGSVERSVIAEFFL